jgi:IS5 family transposase
MQTSFLTAGLKGKTLKCERFLNEMKRVVPWTQLAQVIAPHYPRGEGGRPTQPLERMLKIHCLQQWFALSDPAAEEAIYDRASFQRFLDLDLLSEDVPDETTILHFRHLLERHQLAASLFERIGEHLAQQGVQVQSGRLVDATLIAAASSTKNQTRRRDPEMSSTKKGNQWHFGLKAHVSVDAQTGLVTRVLTSTAKVHDKQMLDALLTGEEHAVIADKGYYDQGQKKVAREKGIFWGVLDRAVRGQRLSGKQAARNRQLASVRAKVEHPFQVLKCQWGYVKARYRGLAKNTSQLHLLFGLINLYRLRHRLLAPSQSTALTPTLA